jgi:hypothetical protein
LFIADTSNQRIRKVDTNGLITTVAGNGTSGFAGDGGAATSAKLWNPSGVAVDGAGNLFIADHGNSRIRKVDTNGIITTVAGNGTAGYAGDGGAATNSELNGPVGVAVDAAGNLFIADRYNQRIRKVNAEGAAILNLTDVGVADAGTYSVVVTSPYGSVTSSIVTVKVTGPPLGPVWALSEPAPDQSSFFNGWSSIAISADGRKLIAGYASQTNDPQFGGGYVYNGMVYLSTNAGASWQPIPGSGEPYGDWYSVTMSADGSKLFGAGWYVSGISTDGGSNWVSGGSGESDGLVCCSADGNNVALVDQSQTGNGYDVLHVSAFASGNRIQTPNPWLYLSGPQPTVISPDGNWLFSVDNNGSIWKLAETNWMDFSPAWQDVGPAAPVFAAASSYDGSRLIAGGNGIYTSTNSGAMWITINAPSTNSWFLPAS